MNVAWKAEAAPRAPGCLSEFALERWRQGELLGPQAEVVERHLAGCCVCQRALQGLKSAVPPVLDLARFQVGPLAPEERALSWWRRLRERGASRTLVLGATLASAVVVLALGPWTGGPGERTKGQAWQLGLVSRTADGRIERVMPGEDLAPGNRLRFEVSVPAGTAAGSGAYVGIVSLDGTGAVSPFWPPGDRTRWLPSGQRQLLQEAIALDDNLGAEKLFLIACPQPMPLAALVSAGRVALGAAGGSVQTVSALGVDCPQASFWFRKVPR